MYFTYIHTVYTVFAHIEQVKLEQSACFMAHKNIPHTQNYKGLTNKASLCNCQLDWINAL